MTQSTFVANNAMINNQNFPVFNDILKQLDQELLGLPVASCTTNNTVPQQHVTAYQPPFQYATHAYNYPYPYPYNYPQQYVQQPLQSPSRSSMTNSTSSRSLSSAAATSNNNSSNNKTSIMHLLTDAPRTQLKDFVFISKQFVQRLRDYIVAEPWGVECALLYKYIDYMFRCQSFARQVLEIAHTHHAVTHRFLLFHCGLQRRSDNQFLYALLIPNTISAQQPWRAQFGAVHNSFMSQHELFKRLREFEMAPMREASLPQRTLFYSHVCDMYYEAAAEIGVDWSQRLATNQDRILKVIGKPAFQLGTRQLKLFELSEAFDAALQRTQLMAQMNARIAVPQGFVDNKCGRYRMELLLPLTVKFGARYYKFALAIAKDRHQPHLYIVKSILTLEMAYANARLCGYVDSVWLTQSHAQKQKNGSGDDVDDDDDDINRFCVSSSFVNTK